MLMNNFFLLPKLRKESDQTRCVETEAIIGTFCLLTCLTFLLDIWKEKKCSQIQDWPLQLCTGFAVRWGGAVWLQSEEDHHPQQVWDHSRGPQSGKLDWYLWQIFTWYCIVKSEMTLSFVCCSSFLSITNVVSEWKSKSVQGTGYVSVRQFYSQVVPLLLKDH